MNSDTLTTCRRCGSNACYEQESFNEGKTYLCMGCGFSTSTELTEGGELVTNTLESSPELYKDLAYTDENNNVWFPATITLPGRGMVFIDGTSKEDWKWAAIKAVPIPEDERDRYPSDQEFKMDMDNASYFDQRGFMDALEVIDFYKI